MTKKEMLMNALDSFYLDKNNEINEMYLNDGIQLVIDNSKHLYDSIKNKRRKPHLIVWEAFSIIAFEAMKGQAASIEINRTYVDSSVLKYWLKSRTKDVETRGLYVALKPSIDWVQAQRDMYFEGRA